MGIVGSGAGDGIGEVGFGFRRGFWFERGKGIEDRSVGAVSERFSLSLETCSSSAFVHGFSMLLLLCVAKECRLQMQVFLLRLLPF